MTNNKQQPPLTQQPQNKLLLIPIIIAVALIPLVMRYIIYKCGLVDYPWFEVSDERSDLFVYYKSKLIIITAVIMLAIAAYRVFSKGMEKAWKMFIPLIVYMAFTILSTIFSISTYHSTKGIFDHFESVYVLLGYCIIAFYGYIIINSEEDIKSIIKWLMISFAVLFVIGTFQFFKHDLIQTTLFKKIIFPSQYWEGVLGQQLQLVFGNQVYLTLFNPNYVGVYLVMLIPIAVILMLFSNTKAKKAIYACILLGMLFLLYACSSTTAILTLIILCIVSAFFLRKYLLKHWKICLISIIVIILAIVGFDFAKGNSLSKSIIEDFTSNKAETIPNLTEVVTQKDKVKITYKGNTVYVSYDIDADGNFYMSFKDSNKKDISHLYDTEDLTLNDDIYDGLEFQQGAMEGSDIIFLVIKVEGENWIFTKDEKETYVYMNSFQKMEKLTPVKSFGFENKGDFASARGYIWSRSFPLLKENLIIGGGPDTFAIQFPQNDYVGKTRYLQSQTTAVDKPHNMFLQMWIQTGLISLLAFLIFYGCYLVQSIKLYKKGIFDTYLSQIGFAIFLSTLSFMISGLANDSNVNVSPIFWGLLGIGMAVNHLIHKKAQ